jgi:predicted O-methyltransferase YrrM
MKLPWYSKEIDGTVFQSSVTDREIARLRELAEGRSVLEVGTAYGYSAAMMGQVAEHVVTVDPHRGYGSLPNSGQFAAIALGRMGLGEKISMMIGRSQEILPILLAGELRFQLVFIDGDHRFATVQNDLELGYRLLTVDGVLAVHDYGEETCPEVELAVDHVFEQEVHNEAYELIDTLWVLGCGGGGR